MVMKEGVVVVVVVRWSSGGGLMMLERSCEGRDAGKA